MPLKNCFRCGKEFSAPQAERACDACRKPKSREKKTTTGHPLSFREGQIVALVAQTKLNKEIAFELHLKLGTVKEYLSRILRKVDVSNRTELAVWAVRRKALIVSEVEGDQRLGRR